MALAGDIEFSGGEAYMVCSDLGEDGTCPDYTEIDGRDFIEASIGNPWGDMFCWYWAEPVCGPETAIPDRCCYELIDWAVICA